MALRPRGGVGRIIIQKNSENDMSEDESLLFLDEDGEILDISE